MPESENPIASKPPPEHPACASGTVADAQSLPKDTQEAKEKYQRGELADAERLCRMILNVNSDCFDALHLLGLIAAQTQRMPEAVALLSRAVSIDPSRAEAHGNLGNVLHEMKRYEQALESFNRALKINPDLELAHCNRGIVLSDLNRHEAALESYEHALKLKPDYVEAHLNLSLHLLRHGNFARGWEEYEWRWQMAKNRDSRITLCAPVWEGQKLHGSLLVWNEHGLGDEIFYAGMLNDLAPYAEYITVCVDHRLVPLFQRSFGNMHVISWQMLAPDAQFDAHIALGSLGRYLRSSVSAFPDMAKPYLRACESRARNLRAKIAQKKRLMCGLSWISKGPAAGKDKSLRLQDIEPILTVPGMDFVDLQYGDTDQEQAALYAAKGLTLRRVTEIDNFNDLDGLAALIEACDIIVTVSNTTAHLAAALGKPVLLMLPFSQGLLWYWQMEGVDNRWYPTVKCFRQPVVPRCEGGAEL